MLHQIMTISTTQQFGDFISLFGVEGNDWSEQMQTLGVKIFHQDLVISKTQGDGLTKEEFLGVLKSLRKSRARIQIQNLKATFSDSFDCTLIFDLPESVGTTRPFCLRTTMIIREGKIWSMFLNDSASPYIFNLFVVQAKVSALLKENGIICN